MSKLLELPAIEDEGYRQHYNAVKSFLKVQVNEGDKTRLERMKRAESTPGDCFALRLAKR